MTNPAHNEDIIDYVRFCEVFRPHLDDEGNIKRYGDAAMLPEDHSRFVKERMLILNAPVHTRWTLFEEDGNRFIIPGIHLGDGVKFYILTDKKWISLRTTVEF